jgi:hypothetical protein
VKYRSSVEAIREVGLEVNTEKTKYMVVFYYQNMNLIVKGENYEIKHISLGA